MLDDDDWKGGIDKWILLVYADPGINEEVRGKNWVFRDISYAVRQESISQFRFRFVD
jgi:hypothetical protein